MGDWGCVPCQIRDPEPNHKSTPEHGYNFHIWEWKHYRPSLVKNRNGIEIDIQAIENGIMINRDYNKNKGTYTFTVLTEQFLLNRNRIFFKCTVRNVSKSVIYITNANSLYDDYNFKFKDSLRDDTVKLLQPKSCDTFHIEYYLKQVVNLTQKFPIAISFQNEKDFTFTIARSIVVQITDGNEDKRDRKKSPFTKKQWKNISIIHPPVKPLHYKTYYAIPPEYDKIIGLGLNKRYFYDNDKDYRNCEKLLKIVEDDICQKTYADFWHLLLWLEEYGEALQIQCYNMEKVKLVAIDDYLELEVPGLAEKRPSVLKGDMIDIRITEDHVAYRGFVTKTTENHVHIREIDTEFVDLVASRPDLLFDVRFNLQRLPLERKHLGVDKSKGNRLALQLEGGLKLINPSFRYSYILQDNDFFNYNIKNNPEQKQAVLNILNGTSQGAPYIVFGPPGTGKTVTIIEAIVQIKVKTKKRILVCAPSNAACDMITMKLMQYCDDTELIRVLSDVINCEDLPVDFLNYTNYCKGDKSFRKISVEEVNSYRIVVTTLIHIGKFARFDRYKPDCVFIDEAAQASEPETDIAIGFLTDGKMLVLAGDHKQLGPVVCSKIAEKYRLNVSLLERLALQNDLYRQQHPYYITMLKKNFRNHPNILAIPNMFFYGNQLQAMATKALTDPLVKIAIYPLIPENKRKNNKCQGSALEFCSVFAKERKEITSYFNHFEQVMVIKYVKALINGTNLPNEYRVKQEDIGIVTPYIRQVYKIKDALHKNGFLNVEVGTTETFQGREKRIIIVSTVRAQHCLLGHDRKFNLGFVRNDKRFNVLTTRAMSKLIVIGCPTVLETDKKWLTFIEMCEKLNTYFGPAHQRRSGDFKNNVIRRLGTVNNIDQYKIK